MLKSTGILQEISYSQEKETFSKPDYSNIDKNAFQKAFQYANNSNKENYISTESRDKQLSTDNLQQYTIITKENDNKKAETPEIKISTNNNELNKKNNEISDKKPQTKDETNNSSKIEDKKHSIAQKKTETDKKQTQNKNNKETDIAHNESTEKIKTIKNTKEATSTKKDESAKKTDSSNFAQNIQTELLMSNLININNIQLQTGKTTQITGNNQSQKQTPAIANALTGKEMPKTNKNLTIPDVTNIKEKINQIHKTAQTNENAVKPQLNVQMTAQTTTAENTKIESTPKLSAKTKSTLEKAGIFSNANNEAKPIVTHLEMQNKSKDSQMFQQGGKQELAETKIKISSQAMNINAPQNLERPVEFNNVMAVNQAKETAPTPILDQVRQKVQTELTPDRSQISISLNPENLGKVDITLKTINGQLTAQITAESSQVKEELNKGLESLKQSLSDQGIKIENVAVQVQEPAQTNNSNNEQKQQFENNSKQFEQFNNNSSNTNSNTNKQDLYQNKYSKQDLNLNINSELSGEIVNSEYQNKNILGKVDYRA